MQNYIYIETFGCSANKNNSEIIAGLLKQAGYELTNNEKIADILILNTCIVKGKTESKIKRRIQDLSKSYKNKLIIIAGCMPETDKDSLKKLNPNSLLLGTHHIKDIVKLLKDYNENKLLDEKAYLFIKNEEKLCLPKIPHNKLISIIQISEGCLGDCSFCKTKLAKGSLFSYSEENIIKSIQNDLNSGAKEIWLTSQDCASYGLDSEKSVNFSDCQELKIPQSSLHKENKKQKLPELLNKILSLKHNFKLRLGMMNINHLYPILDEIIEIYKNKKIYKFLHIPIQSASNRILADMNRYYQIEQAKFIINKFKNEFPNITLATDLIVGYPSETQESHKLNIEFIKKFKPDILNLSKFSSHKGTEAGKLIPISINIINKRTSELMGLHRKTAQLNKLKFKDKEINVFVDSKSKIPEIYEARDDNYNIILISSKENLLGKTIKIKIKQIGVHHMIGEILN